MHSAHRALALDAARWVAAATVPIHGGRTIADADEPGGIADDLYAGVASVLALAAELAVDGAVPDPPASDGAASDGVVPDGVLPGGAGPDNGGLAPDVVAGVRDRLVRRVVSTDAEGLYQGIAGHGAALLAWAEVTGDPVARAGVDAAVVRLRESWTGSGWPVPARYAGQDRGVFLDVISGAAGIALFLALAGTPDALAMAERAADLLLAHEIPTAAGAEWLMETRDTERMPGFSHGTAGVATALAVVGAACDRPDLVAAAHRGADHLRSLRRPGPGFSLPNIVPPAPEREPVSHGWCHGGSGTSRLFWTIGDLDTVDECLLAIRASGLPARLRPGFWDNLGRCCGSAGVGDVVLDRHRQTGHPDLLAFADVLAADIADRAVRDADGARWSFTAYDADGRERLLPPNPGWMQGAAGIAAFLLRLDRAHRAVAAGRHHATARIAWPDAPDGPRQAVVVR